MGFPRDGAALRDRMQSSGNLILVGVLRDTGMEPVQGKGKIGMSEIESPSIDKESKTLSGDAWHDSARVYELCVQIRNFEIGQLSARNNFFMIFQGVLFAGLLQSYGYYPLVTFLACFCGLLISIFQTRMAAGAKFWQEYWEGECQRAEVALKEAYMQDSTRSFEQYFSKNMVEIRSLVSERLLNGATPSLISNLILNKYSVSRIPIYIGLVFCFVWGLLLIGTLDLGWCVRFPFISGFPKRVDLSF